MPERKGHFDRFRVLASNGFLGSFQIDYTCHRFRGEGLVASYYWLLKSKAREGVSLDELDRAYAPFDLDCVKRARAMLFGRPGRHRHRFRLKNRFADGFSTVEYLENLRVDTFGVPVGLDGVMFDVSAFQDTRELGPCNDVLEIADHLKEAKRLAERNGMDLLGRDVGRVFRKAGDIALQRALE